MNSIQKYQLETLNFVAQEIEELSEEEQKDLKKVEEGEDFEEENRN